MTASEDITLVKNAIHNPGEPRHFMRIVPAGEPRSASVGGTVIAQSAEAVVVKEVGLDLYDHVTYFPRADVNMNALVRVGKTTHCPLKGNTEYFDLVVDGERIAEAAWSYVDTIDVAADLRGLVAFDTTKVLVA
ncbi:MAG: DUF427 domain-containing protein [Acidimicrobiia bacterium]|nr:DUF427 domain-containing protein [Acidimicrobiia bacterium]